MANIPSAAVGNAIAQGIAFVSGIAAASVVLIEVVTIVAQRKLANHNGNHTEKHPKFVKVVTVIGGTLSSGFAGCGAALFAATYTLSVALPVLFGIIVSAGVAYLHIRAVESYLSKPQIPATL